MSNQTGTILVVVILILGMFLIGATPKSVNGSMCADFIFGNNTDIYFEVGVRNNSVLDITWEQDIWGDSLTADLRLSMCTGTNPTAGQTAQMANCIDYDFDHDGDGIADSNRLTYDGGAIEMVGLRGISGFNYLRARYDRNSGQINTSIVQPVLTVCRRSQ